jgi:hypothetical protein
MGIPEDTVLSLNDHRTVATKQEPARSMSVIDSMTMSAPAPGVELEVAKPNRPGGTS